MRHNKKRAIQLTHLLSPLRYPGGKRRLVKYIASLLEQHHLNRLELLIEPFAGGASVSLALLEAGYTNRIALADADPLVGQFWSVVFGPQADFEQLLSWVRHEPITVTQFREVRAFKPNSPVETAYKCLFLSRTSFSGVIHSAAGPLGGYAQKSKYKIDCRFPRDRLVHRLLELRELTPKVVLAAVADYREVQSDARIAEILDRCPEDVLWYLDPPFFRKAERLYNQIFQQADHEYLKQYILNVLRGEWILSYDDVPNARALWADHPGFVSAAQTYSANAARRRQGVRMKRETASELVVASLLEPSLSVGANVIDLRGRSRNHNWSKWHADRRPLNSQAQNTTRSILND